MHSIATVEEVETFVLSKLKKIDEFVSAERTPAAMQFSHLGCKTWKFWFHFDSLYSKMGQDQWTWTVASQLLLKGATVASIFLESWLLPWKLGDISV